MVDPYSNKALNMIKLPRPATSAPNNNKRKRDIEMIDPDVLVLEISTKQKMKKRRVADSNPGPPTDESVCSAIQTERQAPIQIDTQPTQIKIERADPPGPRTNDGKDDGKEKGKDESIKNSEDCLVGNSTQLNRGSNGMILGEDELVLSSMLERCNIRD